jgi:hypothetical protein
MMRAVTILMITTLVMPGCATRGPASSIAPSALAQTTGKAPSAASPDVWRQFAERLPAGARVNVRTSSGNRFTGVILTLDGTGIVVNPRTRVPEPARRVAFDEIAQLELAGNESNLAKAVAIGAGVGAGTFLGLLMLLAAAWD